MKKTKLSERWQAYYRWWLENYAPMLRTKDKKK